MVASNIKGPTATIQLTSSNMQLLVSCSIFSLTYLTSKFYNEMSAGYFWACRRCCCFAIAICAHGNPSRAIYSPGGCCRAVHPHRALPGHPRWALRPHGHPCRALRAHRASCQPFGSSLVWSLPKQPRAERWVQAELLKNQEEKSWLSLSKRNDLTTEITHNEGIEMTCIPFIHFRRELGASNKGDYASMLGPAICRNGFA